MLVVAVLGSLVAPPGAAAAPRATLRTLRSDRSLSARVWPHGRKLLDLPRVRLRPGETRLIRGRLRARNLTGHVIGQKVGVGCGGRAGGTVVTTRNNEGRLTRYREGLGVLTIEVRYLLRADRGGWYTCSLWGTALHRGSLVALARGGRTSIEMREQPEAWQHFEDKCASSGRERTCVYLVPRSGGGAEYPAQAVVLDATLSRSIGIGSDEVVNGDEPARWLEYIADVEVTTCYRGTRSCVDRADRYGRSARSVVETRAEIEARNRLDDAGPLGIPAGGPEDPCAFRVLGPARRTVITNGAHHRKIHHVLRVPLSADRRCEQRIAVRLSVRVVSGNPIKIEAGPGPVGTTSLLRTGTWYSNAITSLR